MADQQSTHERKGSPINPDPNAVHGRNEDATADSGDDSPFENVPSGEKAAAARQPQNAPAPPQRPDRAEVG